MKGFEYEKKYQLQTVQIEVFVKRVLALKPVKTYQTASRDCYYYPKDLSHVLRYRFGEGKSELTFKQNIKDSFSLRKELNIDLKDSEQGSRVESFVKELNYLVGPVINKKIEVFDFADVEVCIYEATSKSKKLICLEIEAKNAADIDAAILAVDKYASLLSLDSSHESHVNNFDFFK